MVGNQIVAEPNVDLELREETRSDRAVKNARLLPTSDAVIDVASYRQHNAYHNRGQARPR
jgi:hypothetical protein